jgi:hypothetical protein
VAPDALAAGLFNELRRRGVPMHHAHAAVARLRAETLEEERRRRRFL